MAFLRDVLITDPTASMFRLFVDADAPSARTPVSDPHYVGTFGVFLGGKHGLHGKSPSFVADLTATLQRIHPLSVGRIQLQLVAVSATGSPAAAGTATPGSLDVTFIAN